jgi:hypothetical protein
LPHIAVILNNDGEVVTARAVASVAEGEDLIAKTFKQFAEAKKAGKI